MTNADIGITIGLDTDPLKKSVGVAQKSLSGLSSFAKGAFVVGIGAATVGIAGLVAGLGASVKAAMDAEEGQAALNAVLESTGGKAGVTAEAANELASSLQNVTKFEDDAILAGESLLLTFTNIGADIFPMATETMLNMSQALGQDLKSSATQLGKALNDPIKGMTALSRVGVTFTEEQKEQIKVLQESGDLMGAQTIILKELETEFGGAARAAGNTFAGKLAILNNKFGDIMETVGGALIPVLSNLADVVIGIVSHPQITKVFEELGQIFAGMEDPVGSLANIVYYLGQAFGLNIKEVEGLYNAVISLRKPLEDALKASKDFADWITTDGIAAIQKWYDQFDEFEGIKNKFIDLMQDMEQDIKGVLNTTEGDYTDFWNSVANIVNLGLHRQLGQVELGLRQLRSIWNIGGALIQGDWDRVWEELKQATIDGWAGMLLGTGIKLDDLRALITLKLDEIWRDIQQFWQNIINSIPPWLGGGSGGFGAGASASSFGGGSTNNMGGLTINFTGGAPTTRAEADYSAALIIDALSARGMAV